MKLDFLDRVSTFLVVIYTDIVSAEMKEYRFLENKRYLCLSKKQLSRFCVLACF
ncbi:MAG: hypothetical protein P8J85_11795 [Alphaproteobacteria bacterium]|nr:hypothetical protein [Alphaproteobacteria bacterium]